MNLLLTGADGYVGWPAALRLAKEFPNARIVGVDNFGRRRWVEECGAVSAIPVAPMTERLAAAARQGIRNISFIEGDLADKDFVYSLFDLYRFDVVVHTASQPSAPYSQVNGERANFTQNNNNQATRNLLWAVREKNLVKDCHFIETTTTGVYGAPEFELPEGFLMAEHKGRRDLIPFAPMGGSWYHMSKSIDAGNLWLANRQWKLSITDLRTAIVYGADTAETILDPRLATRFDFDFFFGVVMNRFCAMALCGYPITIYGKGEQRKPMISVEDTAQSIVNAVRLEKTGEFRVFNQATEVISIVDLAQAIRKAAAELKRDVEVRHIPNPRVEKEEHQMTVDTAGFAKLLPAPRWTVASATKPVLEALLPHVETIRAHADRFVT